LKLYNTKQHPHQNIDEYVTSMRLEALQLDVPEQQLIKIISQNLKHADTKMFVLNKGCQTLNELLEVGRICEASKETDTGISSEQKVIAELITVVSELKSDLQKHNRQIAVINEEQEDEMQNCSENYLDQPHQYSSNQRTQTFRKTMYLSNNSPQNSGQFSKPKFQPRPQTFQQPRQASAWPVKT
jgi:hypothetical protein